MNKKLSDSSNLISALAIIKKKFGPEALDFLAGSTKHNIEVISSGFLQLDLALGVGGFPRGRIIEIYGPESSGKTTLALRAIAKAQEGQTGKHAAFIDAENAFSIEQARKLQVDVDNLLVSQPNCGEDALEICSILLESKAVDIIAIDSVSALSPRSEIDGEIGSSQIGAQARLMSQALRKLSSIVQQSNAVLIFINQLRMKVGVLYGNPETTSGGVALKFYSSVRIDVRKAGLITDQGGCIGHVIKAKVVKNKVAAPFRIAEFDLIYSNPVSKCREVFSVATQLEIISSSGSWYSYSGTNLGQGKEKAIQHLTDNAEVTDKILADIEKYYQQ